MVSRVSWVGAQVWRRWFLYLRFPISRDKFGLNYFMKPLGMYSFDASLSMLFEYENAWVREGNNSIPKFVSCFNVVGEVCSVSFFIFIEGFINSICRELLVLGANEHLLFVVMQQRH